ncbi:MAG TPA: NAD-dependent epimerase/dehydratase family protein [Frateuria sp.]|uniref:SDR family oxidoreductase n=1 Tax=Frateuria sp. TaxID=2211372 RepID=UPI002D8091C8|nr:NAD-dependent epimerase/dehydratase family protein [Frateuria sp.]HET6806044.1 NAD-dependent epimerase/dehydratase family protein [Frateuria sp.]
MTVVVFGASGQIGHFLLPRLRGRGAPVIAVSRQPHADSEGVRWMLGGLPDRVPALPPVAAIVSYGPLQAFAHWLTAAAPAGSPRIVATSSMSAQSKLDSEVPAERAVARQLQQGEVDLAAACAALGCEWTVLRPTLIYGAARDKSLTPLARRAMRTRVFPRPAGRGLRQPVHADDIAQATLAAIDRPANRVLMLGGGERLPAGEMFARVQRSLPMATLPVPVPAWLLRGARHVLPTLRGPLARLEADLVADNGELERLLGIHPRPFRPDPACWIADGPS